MVVLLYMLLLLKATGDTYIPICIMNGMMTLKSRYFTFKAAKSNPAPKAVINPNIKNKGNSNICQPGKKAVDIIIMIRRTKEIQKSTIQTITLLIGKIIIGK